MVKESQQYPSLRRNAEFIWTIFLDSCFFRNDQSTINQRFHESGITCRCLLREVPRG